MPDSLLGGCLVGGGPEATGTVEEVTGRSRAR